MGIPFLKWAGGKRWLVAQRPDLFPTLSNTYIEPFLGSGAVFFHLQPTKALLGDCNPHLINAYEAIRDNWSRVRGLLRDHHRNHCREYYYQMRDKQCLGKYQRAAQFIYLNRTCWNALYRVNGNGQFNVPIGTKTNVLLETDDFHSISQLLSHAEILCSDFEVLIDRAQEGDLIFADPPYTVKHNYNGFIKYNHSLFKWSDQIRLKNALDRARARGATILLTNAGHEAIRDLYTDGYKLLELHRSSVIAASATHRGQYSELIIRNS